MRVGHPVEQNHQRTACAVAQASVGHRSPIERSHLERRALVHGARIERRGKFPRIGDLGLDPGMRDRFGQPVGGIPGDDQPQLVARLVLQRVAHGVQAEQPDGLGRGGASRPLLLDDPLRLFHRDLTPAECLSVAPPRMRRKGAADARNFLLTPPGPARIHALTICGPRPRVRATSCKVRQRTVTPPGRPMPGSIPGSPTTSSSFSSNRAAKAAGRPRRVQGGSPI